jgi:LemA protein
MAPPRSRGAELRMAFILLPTLALVAIALAVAGVFNGLVRARNTCDARWADVDVELRRRHDLVPNLVGTVKGYAAHERGTLEAVTAARGAAATTRESREPSAELSRSENALTAGLRQVFALAERYPDLKANANFQHLQQQLTETENRLQSSRRTFNDAVKSFNDQVQSFPGNVVASSFGFAPRAFFVLDEPAAREPPKVSFTS